MSYPTSLIAIPLVNNIEGIKPIIDITDQLPINKNGGWLKMESMRADGEMKTGPRNYEDITELAIHHSAVTWDAPAMQVLTAFARDHITREGGIEGGIAYHMVIVGDQTYQVNDLLALTWHVPSNNYHTVAICVHGDFTKRNLTEVERNNLYASILTVLSLFPNIKVIKGHKEFSLPQGHATSCPGFDMNRVRMDIQTLQAKSDYMKTEQHAQETAYRIANQALFLYNMAQGKKADGTQANNGEKQWAIKMLLELSPFMKERGLL